jgi:MFS family permease
VGTAVFFALLSTADSIPTLLLYWCGAQVFINATIASLAAILPDRVPVSRRATASVALGLGTLIGNAGGTIVGAQFIDVISTGFLVLAAFAVVMPVIAVLIAPNRSNRDQPGVRPSFGRLMASLRPPRKAPDFYWALWGRLALVLGYFMINGYQLYILTDHIGLSREQAAGAATLNSLLFLAAALVGVIVAGPLSDRTGRRKAFILVATVLFVIAIIVPMLVSTVSAFMVFFIVGGLGFGAYYAVDAALMSEVLPSQESRAKDLGILNIANSGGQILAPAVTSAVIAIGFGFVPVFAGALLACLAGGLMVLPIKSVK